MNILNYADFPAKLRNRTDIQDFLGKYTIFPEYLQSPDLLNNLTWSQYKLLIFFYRLTLGKQRLYGTFTSGDIERRAGIKPQDFSSILQQLKDGSGKKQKNSKLSQLVTGGNQSDAEHDPLFHVCDIETYPKTWQVTFLFPMSRRRYGKNKKSEFQPLTKLWYVGNGENREEVIDKGDFIYTALRRLIFEPVRFTPHDSMESVLTDFSSETLQTHYQNFDDRNFTFLPERTDNAPCKGEFWIFDTALNKRNHLYMFTIFPHEVKALIDLQKLRKIKKT